MAERYNPPNQGHGRGTTEKQLGAQSGLRNSFTSILWGPEPDILAQNAGIGGLSRADVPEANDKAFDQRWRSIENGGLTAAGVPVANPSPGSRLPRKMPVAATPNLVIFRGSNATPFTVRWRITGLDQFGAQQVEVTPWIEGASEAAALVHVMFASKVFSWVSKIEYQSTGLRIDGTDPTGTPGGGQADRLYAGLGFGHWAPALTTADSVKFYNLENNGLGLPFRVIGPGAKQSTQLEPEIFGVGIRNLTNVDAISGRQFDYFGPFDGTNTGFEVGYSSPGFEGTPHKISIRSADFSAYDGNEGGPGFVGFRGLSPLPTLPSALLSIFTDVSLWTISCRTLIGTQEDSNPQGTPYQKG